MEKSVKQVWAAVCSVMVLVVLVGCQSGGSKKQVATEQQLLDSLQLHADALAENPASEKVIMLSDAQVTWAQTLLNNYEDSKNIDPWLFEGGKAGRTCGRFQDAVDLFAAYLDRNPQGEKAVEATFLTGFIYDEDLKKKDKAKGYYEKVVSNYPEHNLADDAQALLDQLYMTDEEIIKMLQEKAQEQQPAS